MKKAATYPAGNSLQDAANSLLVSINSLFCAIKFPVQISSQPVCMEKNGRITRARQGADIGALAGQLRHAFGRKT
jgi:hypothetical protein